MSNITAVITVLIVQQHRCYVCDVVGHIANICFRCHLTAEEAHQWAESFDKVISSSSK